MRFNPYPCAMLLTVPLACGNPGTVTAPEDTRTVFTATAASQAAAGAAVHALAQSIRNDGQRALRPADHVAGHIRLDLPVGDGAPLYANFARGFLPNDGTTAGLVFFRAPECVRTDFNLLGQIDVPAAWSCGLAARFSGHQWVASSGPPPYALEIHYRPVIYFVSYAELLAAIADDVLTIGELNALPSLRIGEACAADHYVINSFAPAPIGDGVGHEWFSARGRLRTGGNFVFAYEEAHVFDPIDEHVFPRFVTHFHHAGPDGC